MLTEHRFVRIVCRRSRHSHWADCSLTSFTPELRIVGPIIWLFVTMKGLLDSRISRVPYNAKI